MGFYAVKRLLLPPSKTFVETVAQFLKGLPCVSQKLTLGPGVGGFELLQVFRAKKTCWETEGLQTARFPALVLMVVLLSGVGVDSML